MPTLRKEHVKRLLDKGKARIVSHVPFVVQLKYKTKDICQPLYGGTDPGRINIGGAVVKADGTCVYRVHLETRNKEIVCLMAERHIHRQASRQGERLARKRLAEKLGTTLKHYLERKLPGYENGTITVKDIINTEAKFNNRYCPDGWLTPTARQLVQTHISMIDRIRKILPVTYWSIELNRFAFMRMDNGRCYGLDFQNGRMKGYLSVKSYVYARQDGRCVLCGGKIEHYHHLKPRHLGGSSLPENLIGVCHSCHEKIHLGTLKPDIKGIKKKYGALSVLNQAVPYILRQLVNMFGEPDVGTCFGWQTKGLREEHFITKDHDIDAYAIAILGAGITPPESIVLPEKYELLQFRRHNRQKIHSQRERTYYLDGKAVCKNRHKRFEQKDMSLEEYALLHPDDVSHLTVKPSTRYYNTDGRIMPGAVFLHKGERYVLTGQLSGGKYYRAYGQEKRNFPCTTCQIVRQNTGIVYVQ